MKKVWLISLIIVVLLFTGCQNIDNNTALNPEKNIEAENIRPEKEETDEVEDDDLVEVEEIEENSLMSLPSEINSALTLTYLDNTKYGVNLDSDLELTFEAPISLEVLMKDLKLMPEAAFDIEKEDDLTYIIKPKEDWMANTIYTVNYKPLDFGKAFQTVDYLSIVNYYPGTSGYSVPVEAVVELYFNSENVTDISEHFSIEPHVEGSFEYYNEKIVFIPEALEESTDYTVKVESGITDGDRLLEEGITFNFKTRSSMNYNSNIITQVINVKPNDPFGVQLRSYYASDSYLTKIYQVTDFDLYKENYKSLKEQKKHEVDFTKYDLVFEETLETYKTNDFNLLQLPELEKGRYIVEFEADNRFVFVQVNNYQVYNATLENSNIYWIVDSEKSQAVKNAKVYQDNQLAGTSNDQGVLVTNEQSLAELVHVDINHEEFLITTGRSYYYYGYYEEGSVSDFWSFMYTDRSVYQSEDTINLYAFLRSYSDETIGKLELKIGNYWQDDYFYEKEVQLDDQMTLTESIDIDNLDYGYYRIYLFSDGRLIDDREFSVRNYEKPELELTSDIDEDLVFSGDLIHYSLDAQYFNGLPYADYTLDISYSQNYTRTKSEQHNTDSEGMITLEVEADVESNRWRPMNYIISGVDKNGAQGYNSTNAYVSVLPNEIMILGKSELIDSVAKIDVNVNHIDISKFTGDYGLNYSKIKGLPYDQTVQINIVDHYIEKTFIETIYNPLHKISVDKYNYEYKKVNLPSRSVETTGGFASFDFEIEEDHRYEISLLVTAPNGNTVVENVYVGSREYSSFNMMQPYFYKYNNRTYDIGDQVEFELLKGDQTPAGEKDNDLALNLILRNGLLSYEVTDQTKYTFEFKEEHRPNILFKTIYFDGSMLHIVPKNSTMTVNYDYKTLEYEIDAKTNKIDYRPGEEVTLTVDVKDDDGKPFSGSMNLSVVDEAYFSIYDDYQDVGRMLHRYVYDSGIIKEEVSSVALDPFDAGAECGEGGDDDYIRDDFKDTAIFETIDIVRGKGTFTFNLPDNLTRWRLTMNAVNTDLEFATAKVNVNTVLPFFIRNIYNKIYLDGDQAYVSVTCDGKEVNPDSVVTYDVILKKDDDERIDSDVNEGKDYTYLELGKMALGTYEITLIGHMDDYKDGIRETIDVIESHINFGHRSEGNLTETFKVSNSDEDTILYIYNGEARQFLDDLYDVLSYSRERVEEIISRNYVQQVINTHFYDIELDDLQIDGFQNWDGGIKELLTANSSINTTAVIAGTNIGVDHFDKGKIITYLKSIVMDTKNTNKDQLKALWGLAAQDQPVLLGIEALLEKRKYEYMTDAEKIYLIFALLEIGDETRASNYAIEFFNTLKERTLSTQEKLLTGALAMRLEFDDDLYYELISKHGLEEDSLGLHKLYYMSLRDMSFKEASFTYNLGEIEYTIDLPDAKSYKIQVEANEGLAFKSVDDNIIYSEMFRITGENIEEFGSNDLSISRTYDQTMVEANDLIKVTLRIAKPERSSVVIRDVIPAGFDYAGTVSNMTGSWIRNDHQNVYISHYSLTDSGTISYYIKAMQPGIYKAEPASVQMYYKAELESTSVDYLEVKHD